MQDDGKYASKWAAKREARSLCGVAFIRLVEKSYHNAILRQEFQKVRICRMANAARFRRRCRVERSGTEQWWRNLEIPI